MKRNFLTITAMMLVLTLALSAVSVGADASSEDTNEDELIINYYDLVYIKGENKYGDKLFPVLVNEYDWRVLHYNRIDNIEANFPYNPYVIYEEMYEYYSPDNTSTGDEATPDYVLIYFFAPFGAGQMFISDVLGDYLFWDSCVEYPFAYSYGIYLPERDETYDLVVAYERNIVEGLDDVLAEVKIGQLMGDMDDDQKLTIKDATYLQKGLAGIEGYPDFSGDFTYSKLKTQEDYNQDYIVDIRDVTAIQKRLAGLEYM